MSRIMCNICGDSRFELIDKYKNKLIEATNISECEDEMKVLTYILYRFWQKGWLDKLETKSKKEEALEVLVCDYYRGEIRMTVNEQKEKFISILSKVKREGMSELIEWLESTSFFTDPASTKYHDAIEGGLCKHSLEVYFNYVKLIGTDYEDETAIIACLLHDVCKIGTYQKTETGYTYKATRLPFGHGDKSVLMIREFIQLTTEEILMIRWHMGAYESKECWNDLGAAQSMYKSVLYIHFADMLSSKGWNL